jgi:hypothetical protein
MAPASIASITRARKSLEYGLGIDRPLRTQSMPPDSLIDKALGIPRFNPTETCSKIRQVALDANQNVRRSAAPKESCASREYDHATADNLSAATDRGDSPAVTGGSVPENGRHRYCLGGCAIGWQGLPRTDGSGANSWSPSSFVTRRPSLEWPQPDDVAETDKQPTCAASGS